MFGIDSVNAANASLRFGIGGTQEARGSASGAQYYVANILEEVDAPGEYFIDPETRTLYLMPNVSIPSSLVVSQLPCLISVHGSSSAPAANITVHGLTLLHTANTFMRLHEVPSGGDFSVHRGAAVFVTGSTSFTFTGSRLTQLGSNGVFLSGYNINASVVSNELTFLGQSGVMIVGVAGSIDGVSNIQQPSRTHVLGNLVHDIGIYVKQSAAIMQSVTRASYIAGNALFNSPRMQTLINDGFAGGTELAYNLGFNSLRESMDCGIYETWDRQPYATTQGDGETASLTPAWTHEHHNFAYVNYRTSATINHDDGSSWYEDYMNVFVYAGYQSWLGHNKHYHDELVLYPDMVTVERNRRCLESTVHPGTSFDEVYTHNSCVNRRVINTYGINGCNVESVARDGGWVFANNTFYYPEGMEPYFPCAVKGVMENLTLGEWQQLTGLDGCSVAEVAPDVTTVVEWARQQLMNNTNMHSRTGCK